MLIVARRLFNRVAGALEMPEREPACVAHSRRAAVASAVALFGGAVAYAFMHRPGFYADFLSPWFAARALLAGANPYTAVPSMPPYNISDPPFYPLPTLLALLPFAPLPVAPAGAIFFGLSSGLLAYGVTRTGYHRLPLFLSAPFFMAASLGQWAPLMMAAALLPTMSAAVILKPNLGLALFAYRPSWRAIVVGTAILLLSVVAAPWWPAAWLHNVQAGRGKLAPLAAPAGFVLLLALLRWRRAAARLLLAMACLPQVFLFADQLPLWLIPRTLRQSLVLTLLSHLGALAWLGSLKPGERPFLAGVPFIVSLVYLPALVLVLLQPGRPPLAATAPQSDSAEATGA